MLDRLLALEFSGIKLGLDNIRALSGALGHPERAYPTVHVAGTNGKGSVTAMMHQALLEAGYRCGRYTSPHLSHLRERFVVDAAPVDAGILEETVEHVLDTAERLLRSEILTAPPTFFEAATAVALEVFRRSHVDIAVVEVGLGGRFDATNVITPVVGAITSIGLDHQQYLGATLEEIAFEKAGIIKPGLQVVTGRMPAAAASVIAGVAGARGATLVHADEGIEVHSRTEAGVTTLALRTSTRTYGPVTLGLRGAHQVGNALVAVRGLEALERHGFDVPASAVERGLARAYWPARLELVRWPGGSPSVLIDAAHNPEGAEALSAYLRRWHPERPPLVIGIMRDKDVDGVLAPLLGATSTVIVTAAPGSRALPPDELARRVRALEPSKPVLVEDTPAGALDRALGLAPMACVAGSIFLAGAVRDVLRERAILREF